MARKNRTPEENARQEKIRELLQMVNIGSMDDIQNLFKETIAEFMENGCVRRPGESPRPAKLSIRSDKIEQWDRPN